MVRAPLYVPPPTCRGVRGLLGGDTQPPLAALMWGTNWTYPAPTATSQVLDSNNSSIPAPLWGPNRLQELAGTWEVSSPTFCSAGFLYATFLAGRLAAPLGTLSAMKTPHPWRQNTPLLANVDFKESLPQTFTTLRGGHVTLCVLTVPVHAPQFPRSLGGSSNRSASRLILNLGVLVFPSSSLSTSK